MPRFSIVVPAYESESTIAETLDAIVVQTFGDWECVVVDDGSTDGTLRIASAYATGHPRIRVVHQDNQGTAGAYNAGVSSATGEFVALCSADDILLPEHLSRMSAFIDSEDGYDIYSSNGYLWWPGERRELCYRLGLGETVHSFDLRDLIKECFFSVGATYRRDLFAEVGGYRVGVYGEDYDFWLRALASGARHRYLPEPLAVHRLSRTQKSARIETVLRSDIRLVSDLRRDFQLSPADSRAVENKIRENERLIAELHRPSLVVRVALAHMVIRVLGRRRARRLKGALLSIVGRGASS